MRSLRALPVAELLAAGLAAGPAAPVAAQPSGTWTRAGSMTTPRMEQTATVLHNGQVLVIGGSGASAELYNPATGTWTATGSMTTARADHGQVLAFGGVTQKQEGRVQRHRRRRILHALTAPVPAAAGGMPHLTK